MPGRPLIDEAALVALGYGAGDLVRRRAVLRETLAALETEAQRDHYRQLAAANLERWRAAAGRAGSRGEVRVIAGDWGEVTGALTREVGACFAALNMANAFVPGGGYVEGMVAQEENMFRRTDCHFRVDDDSLAAGGDRYVPAMTRLLSAGDGAVYLDVDRPRVCMRGAEDRSRDDLGYRWLGDDEVFPFYELRAAAQDMRGGGRFNDAEARRRISCQLDTLIDGGVRHAVLSAFGCGAFRNPADVVARLYREEIDRRREHFALVAFAIFAPGYGPDNVAPFAEAFS